jgi:hypothetical protein
MSGTSRRGANRASLLARATALSGTSGKVCPADRATLLLEAIMEPGDRVTIEGDNQKQADFLASALAKVDPARAGHFLFNIPVAQIAGWRLRRARTQRINAIGTS